jgi:16S rRNA (uracil1498-N3)-methyltransferase
MPARRFFVEGAHDSGAVVTIDGGDAHKIARVLRLHDGDGIEVIDSAGRAYDATIELASGRVRATLGDVRAGATRGDGPAIDVAQALPKGQKMDFVVEKATELGAAAILPFACERAIATGPGAEKHERWGRLAKTAAAQCGRRDVPEIHAAIGFDALLARFAQYDRVLFPWELAPQVPLMEGLAEALEGASHVLIVIGPEGGFTHAEAEAARERGARYLWLGTRILRTETAAMALLAVIDALRPRLGSSR